MTKTVRFIGDIHGIYGHYLKRLVGVNESVQVGDFGFGFGEAGRAEFIDEMFSHGLGTHRMIRGNHDDPDEALKSKHFISDGTVEGNVMYVGGAASIDRAYRTEGVSWWANEESTEEELDELVAIYDKARPEILVTHECPEDFAVKTMIPLVHGISNFPSRTRVALQKMHDIAKPRLHIFGHWHVHASQVWKGTVMLCLPELGYADIEVEE